MNWFTRSRQYLVAPALIGAMTVLLAPNQEVSGGSTTATAPGTAAVEVVGGCEVKLELGLAFGFLWKPRNTDRHSFDMHERDGALRRKDDAGEHEYVVSEHQRGRYAIFCKHQHPVDYYAIVQRDFDAPGMHMVNLRVYPPGPVVPPPDGHLTVYLGGEVEIGDAARHGNNGGGGPAVYALVVDYQ